MGSCSANLAVQAASVVSLFLCEIALMSRAFPTIAGFCPLNPVITGGFADHNLTTVMNEPSLSGGEDHLASG